MSSVPARRSVYCTLLSSDCLVNHSPIPTPRITEEQTPSYLPFSSGLFALKIYKNFWRPWEFKLRNTKFHPSITSSEGTRQTLKLEYKPSMKADTCLVHWERILSCWSSCFSMPILESFPHPSARPQSLVSCGVGTEFHFQKQAVPLLTNLPLPCAGWYLLNCLAGSPGGLPSCSCSVAKLCPTLCDPMDYSTPGFPVSRHLLEFAQVHVHWIGDAIQPSHLLSPSSPSAFNFSQHQDLFPVSPLFASGGQSIGASASASVLPMNIQCWFPLRLTGLIFLQSKGLLRVFSSTTVFRCSAFFMVQLPHPHVTTGKSVSLTIQIFVSKVMSLLFNTRLGLSWLSCTEAVVF